MATIERRVNEKGEISFRVKVRLRGCPSQSATFDRITDAKKWAQDKESSIRDGRHFKTAESKKHTLTETISRYQKEIVNRKKSTTRQNLNHYLEWWKGCLGEYRLSDISSALVAPNARPEMQ